jgi:hypothetical protein
LQLAALGLTNMSYLPPVLTGHQITGSADHTTISLAFNEAMGRGSGMVIVTDGAIQTVIDRSTGLPTLRVVGATETHEIPVSMVGIDGTQVTINADGLTPGHQYRVFIAPGVLQSNGQPFAGVTSSSLLAFKAPDDTTPPALTQLTTDNYLLTNGKSATLTMVFSESVKVDASAIVAPNVTVTGLSSSADGMTWHATITPAPGIEVTSSTISLDMRGVHDKANNQGVGTPSITYQIDTKAPDVTAISLTGLSGIGSALTGPATVKVTFSEKVNIANPSAVLVAPHASLTDFHTTDGGKTWVGTVTPQSGTTVPDNQMYVDLAQVADQSGNTGSGIANAPFTYEVDTQGPALKVMSLNGNTLNAGGSLKLTFELQESGSVEKAAIIAPNAVVGDDLQTIDNGRTWTVTLTPQAGVQVNDNTLSIDMSQIRDVHNVPGSGLVNTPHAYDVDSVAPTATLSLSSSRLSASSPVFVTISFSEPMQTLDKAAIVAQHAAVDSLTSSDGGRTWIAKLLPTTSSGTAGANTVSLDMTLVRDLHGNSGTGTVNAPTTFDVDAEPPTTTGITLSGTHATSTGGPTMTVKFSEAVVFDSGAFSLPHATLSNLHSDDNGITWTATVLADGTGNGSTNAISLDLTKVHDKFGNPAGTGAITSPSYDITVTAPTVLSLVLTGNRVTQKGTVGVTITFNEKIAALDPDWFNAPNATLSGLTTTDGGITWHGTLSSNANIKAISNTFSLDMSHVQDASGNFGSGMATASSSYDVDTERPTATLSLGGTDTDASHAITLTVKFSEPVSGLATSYFTAENASVSNLVQVDSTTWTATLSATGNANTTGNHVSLDMTKVQDLFGNAGSGSVAGDKTYSSEPPPVGITLNSTLLYFGKSIVVTAKFASKVTTLDLTAISAQNAEIAHADMGTDGGYTWYITLKPMSGSVVAPNNVVTINLAKVIDDGGHAGTGTATSPSYTVDTTVTNYAESLSLINDTGAGYNADTYSDFITSDPHVKLVGSLWDALSSSQQVEVKVDGTPIAVNTHAGLSSWLYSPTIAPALADGAHTVSVRVVDGEHSSATITKTLIIDTKAPLVTATSGDNGQDVGQPLVIHFNEAVSWNAIVHSNESDTVTWNESDNFVELTRSGSTSSEWVYINQDNLSADGRTLTIAANDLHLMSGKTYQLKLPGALTDVAGNEASATPISFTTTGSYSDAGAPKIMAALAVEQGFFGIGAQIEIAIKFNEPVTLGADLPELTLNNGAKATYESTSPDHRTIYFLYTVGASDATPPLHYLNITGMGTMPNTVTDLAGNKLVSGSLSLSTLDGYYPYGNVWIDTSIPDTIAAAPMLDADSDSGTKGDLITNDEWPVFHGTGATPGMDVILYDIHSDGRSMVGYTSANEDGSWEIYSEEISEGTHQLAVAQVNEVRNFGALSPTMSVTIDRTANALAVPALDAASDTDTVGDLGTSVTTPKLVGSGAEAGAKVVVMEGASVLQTATANSDGSWSLTLPAQSIGLHNLTVHQTDVAGNTSESTSVALNITAATAVSPVVGKLAMPVLSSDSGSSGSDGITNLAKPVFSGTGALAQATIELLEGSTVVATGTSDAQGAWSLTLAQNLPDGVHLISVRQTDSAQHQGAASDAFHVTIDTTAPSQPGIALDAASDTGISHSDRITNYTKPILSGTGADANATIDLYAGTTLVSTGYADASGNWAVSPRDALIDGTYSFTVRQSDVAGNASVASTSVSVTIDSHANAPSAPSLADASDTGAIGDLLTSDNTPTLSGGGCEANAQVSIFDGTNFLQMVSADASGKWTYTLNTLLDGVHQLSVTQTDAAGNVSANSTTIALKVDTAAPAALLAPVLAASSDTGVSDHDGITKTTTPTLNGTGAEANTRIELYDGTTLLGFTNSDGSGNYSVAVSAANALNDAVHKLSVRQVDAAGNVSVSSPTASVTIDTVAPTVADWTSIVHIGQKFQFVFSEAVVHSNAATSAAVFDSITGSLFNFSDGSGATWTNVEQNGITTSVFSFTPTNSGWVEVAFNGLEDLAGNVITDTTPVHRSFTVDLTGTSFFVPFPAF